MRTEPVNQMAAGNLHSGMSREYTGRKEPGRRLIGPKLARQRAYGRRVIGVINRKGKSDQTGGQLGSFHEYPEHYTAPEVDLSFSGWPETKKQPD
jgi:hypothetical protein